MKLCWVREWLRSTSACVVSHVCTSRQLIHEDRVMQGKAKQYTPVLSQVLICLALHDPILMNGLSQKVSSK